MKFSRLWSAARQTLGSTLVSCASIASGAQSPTAEPRLSQANVVAAISCQSKPEELLLLLLEQGNDPAVAKRQGWQRVGDADDPYLARYALPRPVSVFGRSTRHIAFTGNTVFAVLADVPSRTIGEAIGIVPDIDDDETYVGARKVSETVERDEGGSGSSRILLALQVSTLMSPRGETLAGCSVSSNAVER